MLLLQVMNARRREEPAGAKRGGQQWDRQTFGDMAGATRVPWGPQIPPEARLQQENTVFQRGGSCPQPVLVSAQQSRAGAESPFPPARWNPSTFTASEQWFGAIPPRCQAEVFKTAGTMGAGVPNGIHTGCSAPPVTTGVAREGDAQTSPSRILASVTQQDASKDQAGRGTVPATSSARPRKKVWGEVSPRERRCSEPSCFCCSHCSLKRSPVPQFPHLSQHLAWGAATGAMLN